MSEHARLIGAEGQHSVCANDLLLGPYSGSRVLPLEGGRNFRDLGGYATTDGRCVRWGRLFRSGSMARLTQADIRFLSQLSIRAAFDLRSSHERQNEPHAWHVHAGIRCWSRDYDSSFGDLRKLLASPATTAEEAEAAMMAGYRQLPFQHAPAYTALFASLAAGEVPLVFNCSAGKDRAGVAAALVLIALGVPRDTVVADYVLTATALDRQSLLGTGRKSMLANRSPAVLDAILNADARYLHAALDAIEARCGSVSAYLQDELGVSLQAADRIREELLEAPA
ncbi:MAG: tyrosine-protein phosphatase [Gammaproteobacteria bacterium]